MAAPLARRRSTGDLSGMRNVRPSQEPLQQPLTVRKAVDSPMVEDPTYDDRSKDMTIASLEKACAELKHELVEEKRLSEKKVKDLKRQLTCHQNYARIANERNGERLQIHQRLVADLLMQHDQEVHLSVQQAEQDCERFAEFKAAVRSLWRDKIGLFARLARPLTTRETF